MAKRMVNDAEVINNITEYVRQEGNKTIIGGNMEVDGNLTVNGTAPGGGHVYALLDGSQGTYSFCAMVPLAEEASNATELITKWKAASHSNYISAFGDGASGMVIGLNFSSLSAPTVNGAMRSAEGTWSESFSLGSCNIYKIY